MKVETREITFKRYHITCDCGEELIFREDVDRDMTALSFDYRAFAPCLIWFDNDKWRVWCEKCNATVPAKLFADNVLIPTKPPGRCDGGKLISTEEG